MANEQQPEQQPMFSVTYAGCRISVLGTAHVSRASAEAVQRLLASGDYDCAAVELCRNRYNSMMHPDALANMDLFRVIKEGKASMVMASLALGAYQQRLAEEFGIEPGAEMRVAIEQAQKNNYEVLLIDREIGTTLKRVYQNVPWWKKMLIVSGLLGSVLSREEVSEAEIEKLKDGDLLETTFSQFAEDEKDLFKPLIHERDQYMAAKLQQAVLEGEHHHILAVVGAGHLPGMQKILRQQADESLDDTEQKLHQVKQQIEALEQLPQKRQWLKYLPWLIVALIISGFVMGFQKSQALGWQMVLDWVLINGGLSALGALIATAHPLTIVTAFLAAPLTSLNPMIGAGMVTTAVELWLRKPNVGDFSQLRHDTTSVSGWWKNKVARTFLVFFFSSLGSAIGTYVAGFRIFDSLM